MRVFRYVLFASVCLGFLLCLGSPLMAQQRATPDPALEAAMRAQQEAAAPCAANFNDPCCDAGPPGPKCNEATESRGKYRIYISPQFRGLFAGCPAYESTAVCPPLTRNVDTTFRLDSPNLIDPATVIGRSAAHTHGSTGANSDTGGTPVGDAGNCPLTSCVKDSDFTVLPSCPGPPCQGPGGTREIHTEIVALNLTGLGASVRAGSLAPLRPKSFGEVESRNSTGDFPADSFFDVFVEVDLPPCGAFPGGTVYNPQALLVVNTDVNDLPPQVVYIHGNSSMVPVLFKTTGPGPWVAGDLLGSLSLAGHAVGAGADRLEQEYCAAIEMGTGACCLHNGTCGQLAEEDCKDMLGIYRGDGTVCVGGTCLGACCNNTTHACTQLTDADCKELGKGFRYGGEGTPCGADGTCIPTVSSWGVLVMAVLVLTAGTVVVMRRRAMVRGGS